ncbi:hypothetical protein ACIJYG_05295 [Candidatus Pelagibacter bacterium nBUS_27]|uniref:hypothetical protein n=1 Tax=Candidatus Pelagibacter bacterium nBUS_27 TaxID=3374188 RepID=UPI003EB9152E
MIEEIDFVTFLYISQNKYQIFVYDKINLKSLYKKELKINEEIDSSILLKFLDENIYKIEKIVSNFIKNIILVIENDKILNVNMTIKKKNYEKSLNQKNLENYLTEVKDIFRENYQDQIIMHMIINDYNTNENFSSLSNEVINNGYVYLEVNFISISNSFTTTFDKFLENYQIKISQFMSGLYIKSFYNEDETEPFVMANKLNNGFNKNEVRLVSKNIENKGFFEKFFQLFS